VYESFPITLDGFTFAHGGITELPDAGGDSLVCTKLEGWEGAPGRKLVQTERPGADGVFDGDAYRGARTLTLEATAYSGTQPGLRALLRRLAAICADPRAHYRFTVTDPAGTLSAYVKASGEVKTEPISSLATNLHRGIVSLGLSAPDPLRMADWVSTAVPPFTPGAGGIVATTGVVSTAPGILAGTAPAPTTVTVTNPGTAPAILVAEFDGPTSAPAVVRTDNGAEVRVPGAVLNAGESFYVNLSHHYAHDVPGQPAGSFMYGRSAYGPSGYAGGGGLTVVNGVWPELGPGETATFLFTGGGAGTLHVRPTYW
jgi:hypothetical protein